MLCPTASKKQVSSTSPNSNSESSLVYDPNGILTCDMLRSLGPGLLSGRRSELFSFRMQDYADADVVVLISEIIFRLALKPSSLSWSLLYSLLYSPPLYSINASWFENNMLTWTQTTKYWPWKLVVHVACRARAPTTCWNRSLSLVEHRQLHTAYGAAYSSRLPFS